MSATWPEGQTHVVDLLLLGDDDLLRESLQTLVLAVPQLGEGHVDRSLVVRNHHAREVPIGVAAIGHVHRRMHPRGGVVHHLAEPLWRLGLPCRGEYTYESRYRPDPFPLLPPGAEPYGSIPLSGGTATTRPTSTRRSTSTR